MSDRRLRRNELRNARLLFDTELHSGEFETGDLHQIRVPRSVLRVAPNRLRVRRRAQQVLYKLGRLDYERAVAAPLAQARRAALGEDAARHPPRFLVRVDEFPHYLAWDEPERYGTESFRRFHAIMADAGAPYLVAVPVRVSRAPLDPNARASRALDPGERALLGELAATGGVAFALHGRDHRTRHASPRRHSELTGLTEAATTALLDQACAELAELGLAAEVFVPPYNRFDARQYAALAARFAVICGGPESIGCVGFQRAPVWLQDAVYLPTYRPLYGTAREVLPAARRLLDSGRGLWLPIALHWGWEARDGWSQLEALARLIAPYTASWQDFLAAVRRSEVS